MQSLSKPNTMRREFPNVTGSLLIGIGNDGRADDGLGWAFLNAVEQYDQFKGEILYRYQLQIEDAQVISRADHVLFVDASQKSLSNGYQYLECQPKNEIAYTSHQLSPQSVIFLCRQLYRREPHAQLLVIEGELWDLQIGLSEFARNNLKSAMLSFCQFL